MSQKTQAFKDLLDSQHSWPCNYTFKFIVPKDRQEKVEALFPNQKIEKKESAQGAYMSFTITMHMESADLVIAIYEQAATIEGLISL